MLRREAATLPGNIKYSFVQTTMNVVTWGINPTRQH